MKVFPATSSALTAMLFVSSCAGSNESTDRGELEKEFSSEFGFTPPTNTADIKCKEVRVGDSFTKWMRFSYSSNIFTNIVAENFKLAVVDDLKSDQRSLWEMDATQTSPNPNAPKWWKTPSTLAGNVYFKQNYRKDVPGSYAYVFVDKTDNVIYSESSAWR